MKLQKLASFAAIMAVAWPIMLISAPISGGMTDAISVAFDRLLGSGYWQSIPIVGLLPFVVVWAVYCVAIWAFVYFIVNPSSNAPYPPMDERGKPMKLNFSSRGGRTFWVRSK